MTLSHRSIFPPVTARLFAIAASFHAISTDDFSWQVSYEKLRKYYHFNETETFLFEKRFLGKSFYLKKKYVFEKKIKKRLFGKKLFETNKFFPGKKFFFRKKYFFWKKFFPHLAPKSPSA